MFHAERNLEELWIISGGYLNFCVRGMSTPQWEGENVKIRLVKLHQQQLILSGPIPVLFTVIYVEFTDRWNSNSSSQL